MTEDPPVTFVRNQDGRLGVWTCKPGQSPRFVALEFTNAELDGWAEEDHPWFVEDSGVDLCRCGHDMGEHGAGPCAGQVGDPDEGCTCLGFRESRKARR